MGVATTSSTLTILLERITYIDMAKEINKVEESKTKQEYAQLIEAYKKQNPVKYAAKKAELEKRLASM